MSAIKPLATVERMVTVAGGYGGVRIGGPKGPTWGVNGGLFDRQHDPPADAVAESLAHDINEAHWQAMAPLLALLAQAREALAAVRATITNDWYNKPRKGMEEAHRCASEVIAALDAANPGEWVPAERLKECQRVLADALEEKADVYKRRCEAAVKVLRTEHAPWAVGHALALLTGAPHQQSEVDGPPTAREATPYGLGYVEHEEGEP